MRKCGRGEGNEGAWESEKREIYEEKGKRGSTGRQNNDRQEETNTRQVEMGRISENSHAQKIERTGRHRDRQTYTQTDTDRDEDN